MRSPWERALGERSERLAPGLRAYFGAIPPGSVGRGSGVFDIVGTPRRWLWPVLRALSLDAILVPAWATGVPFTIENRSTARGTVRAERRFELAGGTFVMVDEVGMTRLGLADRLGHRGLLLAHLAAEVVDGHLELTSTGTTLFGIPLGRLSPRLTLIERTAGARQHVSLTLDAPLIGRLYEYSGSFTYSVETHD